MILRASAILLTLLCLTVGKVYGLTQEEIISIIRQLESAGFYEEAQKYKRLLRQQIGDDVYTEQSLIEDEVNKGTNDMSERYMHANIRKNYLSEDIYGEEETEDTKTTEGNLEKGKPKKFIQDEALVKKLTIWKYIQENPAKAIEILEKEEKTPDVLKKLGIAYYNLGDYIQAIKYLKAYTKTTAFEEDKDKYKILILLAYAYKNIFDENTFRKYLQYVFEHRPDLLNTQDKLVLAFIYLSKDELGKVREIINSFSDKDFENLPKKDLLNLYSLYYVKLGYRYLCSKNYRKALEYAYKAERYKPNFQALTELKAWLYLNMGEYRKALHLFKQILRYKRNPNIYYGIALAYSKLENKAKAIRYLHLAENGADRLLFYKIARLYYDLGEKRQALRIIKLLREGRIGIKITSAYSCNKEAVFYRSGGNEDLREIPNLSLPKTKNLDLIDTEKNADIMENDNIFGTTDTQNPLKKKEF